MNVTYHLGCFIFILRTLAVIKPDAIIKIGDLFELIHAFDLIVTKAKMTTLTR